MRLGLRTLAALSVYANALTQNLLLSALATQESFNKAVRPHERRPKGILDVDADVLGEQWAHVQENSQIWD